MTSEEWLQLDSSSEPLKQDCFPVCDQNVTERVLTNVTPGVNYYLSCWYKRSEFGIRAAIFFSAAAFAGSFGGLLAAAIA